ncbi:MAG: gliding motility protein GldN, partial [Bacteroidetes bacterium]
MKQILFVLAFVCLQIILPAQPLNDITKRTTLREKSLLAWSPIHERDILWEKKLWRVLDVREKMNLPFIYPPKPLFQIITQAALDGQIPLYSAERDDFSIPLSESEIAELLYRTDTALIFDPTDYSEKVVVVKNALNYEDVKRFRIKETWFFDSQTSTLRVRILGIAPLLEVYDENGNFRHEKPLFWIHYPSSRELLSHELAYAEGNDSSPMTWEDLFESRHFSSHIYKVSNVRDNRLQDLYSGVDLLLEADKINQSIFN